MVEPTVPQLMASQDILVGFLGRNNLLEKFTSELNPTEAVIVLATAAYMVEFGDLPDDEQDALVSQAFDDSVNALEMAGVDEN